MNYIVKGMSQTELEDLVMSWISIFQEKKERTALAVAGQLGWIEFTMQTCCPSSVNTRLQSTISIYQHFQQIDSKFYNQRSIF